MKYFPTLCVDNFFENPDRVREFALMQQYETSSNTYAGTRTDELANLNKDLFDAFCHKVLTLFNTEDEIISLKLSARFQKIPRVSSRPELNTGWVHDDGENIFAGLVYLNPTPNPESGTSLYMLKEGEKEYDEINTLIKRDLYGNNLTNEQTAVDAITRHNAKFIETARFNNVYNRLVCYDASVYHKANSYDNDEDRLTLVFFLQELESKSVPLIRSRSYII